MWILAGLGVFVVLVVLFVAGTGLFLVQKARQFGFNSEEMKRNPSLAITKMLTTFNPDLEIVSSDEGSGKIRVRERKTGKTYTIDFEDAKRGKFTVQADGKPIVTVNGDDEQSKGSVEVNSPEGTVKVGEGGTAKVPAWIPDYPGSEPKSAVTAEMTDGKSGVYTFSTRDSIEKVGKFYDEGFKSAGLKTTSTLSSDSGMVSAETERKSAVVTLTLENGNTKVGVTYRSEK